MCSNYVTIRKSILFSHTFLQTIKCQNTYNQIFADISKETERTLSFLNMPTYPTCIHTCTPCVQGYISIQLLVCKQHFSVRTQITDEYTNTYYISMFGELKRRQIVLLYLYCVSVCWSKLLWCTRSKQRPAK